MADDIATGSKKKKKAIKQLASEYQAPQNRNAMDESPERMEPPEDDRLGIEIGVESNLPFSAPYRPLENGTKKSAEEELLELFRDDTEHVGPTVKQLMTMRRLDGQAQQLYRLLTLPIRSALEQSSFVPADGGEKEAEFIELVFQTAPANGGMSVPFEKFMAQMLQSLFDGFVAFEKVFWSTQGQVHSPQASLPTR
jgi:hypothetical protein